MGLLVLAGRKRQPSAALIGRPASDAALRIAQASFLANEVARADIARVLVMGKLKAQYELLCDADARTGPSIELNKGLAGLRRALDELASGNPSRERLRGIEGAAGAAYFRAFVTLFAPSLGFEGRNRRPPRDPVNACLSLGYTLLHFDAVREAASVGLDPLVGVYHDLAPGRESLACDLAEPFRACVDRLVLQLFTERVLRAENFTTAKEGCLMGKRARCQFYGAYETAATAHRPLIARLARRLAKAIRDGASSPAIAALDPTAKPDEDYDEPEDLDYRL